MGGSIMRKVTKAKRSQYLSYQMIERLQLNPLERAVLQTIWSKPHYLMAKLSDIGRVIGRSGRTVQRAIKTLVEKGIIVKQYTTGKIQRLKLVALEVQNQIAKHGPILGLLKRALTKSGHDKNVRSDTTSVSGPIKNKEKELVSFRGASLKPKKIDLNQAKEAFFAKARALGHQC